MNPHIKLETIFACPMPLSCSWHRSWPCLHFAALLDSPQQRKLERWQEKVTATKFGRLLHQERSSISNPYHGDAMAEGIRSLAVRVWDQ